MVPANWNVFKIKKPNKTHLYLIYNQILLLSPSDQLSKGAYLLTVLHDSLTVIPSDRSLDVLLEKAEPLSLKVPSQNGV